MTRFFLTLLSLCSLASTLSNAQETRGPGVHIGLIYPLSTNGTSAAAYTNKLSLHAVAGLSGGEQGLALNGVAGIVKGNQRGAQLSGFGNIISGNADGLLMAGFINKVGDSVRGLQSAGFINLTGSAQGMQAAGFANIAQGPVHGLQLAGFTNVARGAEVQASGFINISSDTTGTQIAGFINIARKVKGAQIAGFINIADSSDSPIGIINIIRNGEMSISASTDEILTNLLSFRSGGRIMYGIIGAGYNFKHSDDRLYAMEAGIGAHLITTKPFRLNAELASVCLTDFDQGVHVRSSLRLLPVFRTGPVSFFAGPVFSQIFSTNNTGAALYSSYLWRERTRNEFNGLVIGGMAGLQLRIR